MTTEQAAALAAVSGNVGSKPDKDFEKLYHEAVKELDRTRQALAKCQSAGKTKAVEVWRVEYADRQRKPGIAEWTSEKEATDWFNLQLAGNLFTNLKLTGPFKQEVPG